MLTLTLGSSYARLIGPDHSEGLLDEHDFPNSLAAYLPPLLAEIGYAWLRLTWPIFLPRLDEVSPLQAIGGIPSNVPVLILPGAADPQATPAEAQALFDQVSSHGALASFPRADHNSVYSSDPDRYRKLVLDFVRQVREISTPSAELLPFRGFVKSGHLDSSVETAHRVR